jgi:hypothetical protein
LFLAGQQNFFFFDNDVYMPPHYSDMMRGLLLLSPSVSMNAAAPDGASLCGGSVTKNSKKLPARRA